MDHETKRHGQQNTRTTEDIARRHGAGLHLSLPKAITKEIENRLADQRAVMRLDQLREQIRAKRDRRVIPGGGIVWGVIIGTAMWAGIIALAVVYLS